MSESLFDTIPAMSFHTEDKEVQGLFERKRKLHSSYKESLFYTIPVMNVHTEDKEEQGVCCCLKERESCHLVGIIIIKSLFYAIPAMSVHTEDKDVQGLFEIKKVTIWLESSFLKVYFLYYTSDECPY